MKLAIKWKQFEKELMDIISLGDSIYSQLTSENDQNELLRLCKLSSEWQDSLKLFFQNNILETSIPKEVSRIEADKMRALRSTDFKVQARTHIDILKSMLFKAKFYFKLLSVCDKFTNNNDRQVRLSGEDINLLVLKKLYSIYDDNFYPISFILSGNGIETERSDSAAEIGDYLEKRGFVELNKFGSDNRGRLTYKGKLHVEKSMNFSQANFETMDFDKNEVNTKIDSVIVMLHTICDGQEIIFDELEKLKDLYQKLDKRQWHQLLLGTLLQASIEKTIDIVVAKEIFNSFISDQTLLS